jgi:hypothetical protein
MSQNEEEIFHYNNDKSNQKYFSSITNTKLHRKQSKTS